MADPFISDDHNPFAEVDEYNPFKGSAPRVVINESPAPPSFSPAVSSPSNSNDPNPFASTSSYGSMAPIKLEDSDDSDDGPAPTYFDMKVENPYQFSEKPLPVQGMVSVQHTEADDGEGSIFEIAYYQQFFNIDSSEVGWRCLRSMWPFKVDFINFVSTNPDFYGPFWITTTLIFMMAACSNFSTYLNQPVGWKYDFLKLTVGTGIIYGFAFGIPFLFWLYFKWADLNISLIEIMCIYGYSLFIYIPVAIISIAPFHPVQWAVFSVGCLLSTSFIVVNMWNPLRGKLAHAIPTVTLMALLHAGIGLTFVLYFFQFVESVTPVNPTPAPMPAPTPAI